MRGDELRAAGVSILRLPVRSFKSPRTLGYGWRLARYIRAHRIRLVHTFDLPLTAAAIPLTRLFTPAIALASQRSHLGLVSPRMRKALTFSERMAHGVVVNCEFLRRHLMEDAGIPGEKIHLCRNGIDLVRFCRGAGDPRFRPGGASGGSAGDRRGRRATAGKGTGDAAGGLRQSTPDGAAGAGTGCAAGGCGRRRPCCPISKRVPASWE